MSSPISQQTGTLPIPPNQIQVIYLHLQAEFQRLDTYYKQLLLSKQAEASSQTAQLMQKVSYYQSILGDKGRRVIELEQTVRKLESEENEKNRKQIRRYVESSNEKEAENVSLKRQVNSLKAKLASVETELASAVSSREDLQVFIGRGLEQLRASHKEMSNSVQETETDKLVMESKYKQVTEKLAMLTQKISQLEIRLSKSQESLGKTRQQLKVNKQQSLSLKFQVEQLRQKLASVHLNPLQEQSNYDQKRVLAQQINGVIQLGQLLKQRQAFLTQTSAYHQLNTLLAQDNRILKDKVNQLEHSLDDWRRKHESGYQDQSMKNFTPSLYDYLLKKQQQLSKFESTIEKIENYVQDKDDTILKLLNSYTAKKMQCECGKEAEAIKLQGETQTLGNRNNELQQLVSKLKKQIMGYDKIMNTYRLQLKQFVDFESGNKKGKKKIPKKRCYHCFLSIEKGQSCDTCNDCKKWHHSTCLNVHNCEIYKLDDGLSMVSGME